MLYQCEIHEKSAIEIIKPALIFRVSAAIVELNPEQDPQLQLKAKSSFAPETTELTKQETEIRGKPEEKQI